VIKAISEYKTNSIEWGHIYYEEQYKNLCRQCSFIQRTTAPLLHLV